MSAPNWDRTEISMLRLVSGFYIEGQQQKIQRLGNYRHWN